MKTAISIPPKVFESAEKLAEQMHISRSQLYVTAIKSFLESHDEEGVTEKLNVVYGGHDSGLDPALLKLQKKSLPKGHW